MAGDGFALGQDRDRGVVAVQALGGEHMRLDEGMQRRKRARAGADLVRQRRDAEVDALAGEAPALPVERLMLREFVEQDHGQQAWPGKAARRHMERCRRLGDRLAGPAGELLAHGLNDLPAARNDLERLGDVLAQLRQLRRTATRATGRRRDHDALARQVFGERLARGAFALEGLDRLSLARRFLRSQLVLGGGGLELFKLQLHLLE